MEHFESTLHRYLTRKIGFESVMRIRCTKGEHSTLLYVFLHCCHLSLVAQIEQYSLCVGV